MQQTLSASDLETLFWVDLVWLDPAKQGDIYSLQVDRMRTLEEDEIVNEVKRFGRLAEIFALMRTPGRELDLPVRAGLERLNEWAIAATEPLVLHLLHLRS